MHVSTGPGEFSFQILETKWVLQLCEITNHSYKLTTCLLAGVSTDTIESRTSSYSPELLIDASNKIHVLDQSS